MVHVCSDVYSSVALKAQLWIPLFLTVSSAVLLQYGVQVCRDKLGQSWSVVVRRCLKGVLVVWTLTCFLPICTGSLPKVRVYRVLCLAEVYAGISPTGYEHSVKSLCNALAVFETEPHVRGPRRPGIKQRLFATAEMWCRVSVSLQGK